MGYFFFSYIEIINNIFTVIVVVEENNVENLYGVSGDSGFSFLIIVEHCGERHESMWESVFPQKHNSLDMCKCGYLFL